jgi:transposase
MERLKFFKNNKTRNKWNNFLLSSWGRKKLQEIIEYKAKWEGIPVVYVNPYLTSQICCYCGSRGERNGKHFYCPSCNKTLNADFNASVNIARTAFRRLKRDDREAFPVGSNACGEGNTYLPRHTNTQPGNGQEMKGMMVIRTLTCPLAVGGG